jgi:RNA polymerase sigma-70 factor (ECF subfamily)
VRDTLRAAAARVVPSWLADQRDDIVQAAMLRLIPKLSEGDPEGRSSPAYLWRVAYSITVDEIRRRRCRPEEQPSERTPEAGDRQPTPERALAGREIGLAIRGCLEKVLADRRRAVTLYLQGHGPSEIARLMGWNIKRAENLVARGLDDLRTCLKRKGVTP